MTNQMNHNENDRVVTNSLIDQSDLVKHSETRNAQKTVTNDWTEATVGWKTVFTYPRLTTTTNTVVKKRKAVERSLTDLHSFSNYQDDYWSSASDCKPAVRCIGDDFESFPTPPWKSNVEQGTYRYIPDNGSYRTLKFMWDDRKEWYTIRKKHPEKVSAAWHQSCKKMQREMKRQLKKDMPGGSSREQDSKSSASGMKDSDTTSGDDSSQTDKDEKRDRPDRRERQLYRKETRVRSTQSDSATAQRGKMSTIVETEHHTTVPSIPGPLTKSASDLFIENFSSRLNALEEEMKKDSKWLRKPLDDVGVKLGPRTNHRDYNKSNLKESHTTSNTPRMPVKTETLTSDVFSVKQVGQRGELKPLEKTRSYKYGNQSGDYVQNTRNVPNYGGADLEKTINNYKVAIENTKQSLFNTLTGTKILTQNARKPPKGFSVPSTITICDTGNNGKPGGNTDQHRPGSGHRLTTRTASPAKRESPMRKGPIQAILPEIAGKRLEVSAVSHRLL